jgi:nicotinic acid phosphoribosyltransferase
MTSPLIDLNSKHIKTYATRENLVKAMEAAGVGDARYLIVRNDSGRWVCIVVGFQQHLLGAGIPMVG